MEVGPDNIPIPSTLSGKNVNLTYLALKTPSPITIGNMMPTQLPVSPGPCTIQNPLGNPLIAVGGLTGENDQPYFITGQTGVAKGTIVQPGASQTFQVTDSSLLSVISQRANTIIMVTGNLSQANYTTQISDPAPDPASLPPFAVVSTTPANNAINVSTSQVIEIVFNRQIGQTSVALADVAVVPQVSTLDVYIDPTNSSQLDLDPKGSNLSPGTLYTVTISNSPPDVTDNNGTAMLSPYSFSFTCGTPPPPPTALNVASVTPGNNTTGVAVNTVITVIMTTPVVSSGVTTSNVELIQVGGSTVTSTVSLGTDNKTITITPSAALSFSTEYKVVVQNLVSLQGVNQSPSPWDGVTQGPNSGAFTTSSTVTVNTVSPGNNATGVAINTTVAIVMSAQVKSADVTSANVELINVGTSAVISQAGGSPSLAGDLVTITITPAANLSTSTQYKVVVQNQQTLASVTQVPNPWDGASQGPGAGEFTTIAPPTVSSVSPGNAATGVAITTTVAVIMSQTMQSAGVTTSNVKLINVGTGGTVTSTVSLGSDQQTITITPSASLAYNTEYKVTVANLVGTDGATMSPSPWDGASQGPNDGAFTTVAQPTVVSVTPGNNATGVAVSTSIVVVMSEPILSGGVTTSNVELFLASNNTTVAASVSLAPDNETITITPTSSLAYSTQYYVVVQNLASVVGSVTQTPNPYDPFTSGSLSSIYNISQDNSQIGTCSPTTGNGYSCYINTSGYYAVGEIANSSNGLIGAIVQKVIVAKVHTQNGNNGHVGIQIVKANGTVAYTFSSTVTVNSISGVSVTLTDTSNTYALQSGDGVFVTWDQNEFSENLAVSKNASAGFSSKGGSEYNGSNLASQSFDLAAQIFAPAGGGGANAFTTGAQSYTQIYNVSGNSSPCNNQGSGWGPEIGGGNLCSIGGGGGSVALGTGSDNLNGTFGEIASSSNGLVGKVVNKVILATVIGSDNDFSNTSSTPPTGNVGIKIVNSSGTTKYTFSSSFAATSTGFNQICNVNCGGGGGGSVYGWSNVTIIDTANTYVMQTGDAVVVTWSGTGQNVLMLLQNTSNVYGKAGYQNGSGSVQSISGVDLAATIYSSP